jgi:hypothetical protein
MKGEDEREREIRKDAAARGRLGRKGRKGKDREVEGERKSSREGRK